MTGWGPAKAGHYETARRIPCASLFLAGAAAVLFLWPDLATHLQYDRAAIAAGEVWRLVAGHWTHYSFDHLFWDVLAFAALGVVCERRSRARFLFCLITSALAISVSVWLIHPEIQIYRGLSGIDSALFTFAAIGIWSDGRDSERPGLQTIALVCLAGFLLKVAFELMTGRTVFVSDMDTLTVGVPLAHIVGACCGLVAGAGPRVVLGSNHTHTWSNSTA